MASYVISFIIIDIKNKIKIKIKFYSILCGYITLYY